MKSASTIRKALRRLRARVEQDDTRGSDYAYVAEAALLWALEDERKYDIVEDTEATATAHEEMRHAD